MDSSVTTLNRPKNTRIEISEAIAIDPRPLRVQQINRGHLFYRILASASGKSPQSDRVYFAYEFSLIEKVVKAAQAGDLVYTDAWLREVEQARRLARNSVSYPESLDILLYPARALKSYIEGDRQGTLDSLNRSHGALLGYLRRGGQDAAIAILEQKLNEFRCYLKFDSGLELRQNIESLVPWFTGSFDVAGVNCRSMYESLGSDESVVLLAYLDQILPKIASRFTLEELISLLCTIAEPETAISSVRDAARICVELYSARNGGQLTASPRRPVAPHDTPLALLALIDAFTADDRPAHGDHLSESLEGYLHRGVFIQTVLDAFITETPMRH